MFPVNQLYLNRKSFIKKGLYYGLQNHNSTQWIHFRCWPLESTFISSSYRWGEENFHPYLYPDSFKVESYTRCESSNSLKCLSDLNSTSPWNMAYPQTVPGFFVSWKNMVSPIFRILQGLDLHSNVFVPFRSKSKCILSTTNTRFPLFGRRIFFRYLGLDALIFFSFSILFLFLLDLLSIMFCVFKRYTVYTDLVLLGSFTETTRFFRIWTFYRPSVQVEWTGFLDLLLKWLGYIPWKSWMIFVSCDNHIHSICVFLCVLCGL